VRVTIVGTRKRFDTFKGRFASFEEPDHSGREFDTCG
jgi:hypothetical protein